MSTQSIDLRRPARGGASMTQIVAENVRRLRLQLGWTQRELRDRLAAKGIGMDLSRPTIVALESGKRSIEVSELFALALVLGVAPHVLLYPQPGTNVRVDPESDEQTSSAYPGRWVADWLWDPDPQELSTAKVSELARWIESTGRTTEEALEEANRGARRRSRPTGRQTA
jgi:transcriptional regulator with XRE-family HTH domain